MADVDPGKKEKDWALLMEMLESKNSDACASGLYAIGKYDRGNS